MALAHGLTRRAEERPGILGPGRGSRWRGADAVLYFQMRHSLAACEKYHGAVLDHVVRTDTRVFREVAAQGKEFAEIGVALLGARTPARVALLVATGTAGGPSGCPTAPIATSSSATCWPPTTWHCGIDAQQGDVVNPVKLEGRAAEVQKTPDV